MICPIRLHRAIIERAVSDATTLSKKPDDILYREPALNWIKKGDEDFVQVCENANLNPKYIQKKILEFIASGAIYRNDRHVEERKKTATIQRS